MFQIYAAVNGCRIQCFWLSSSSQLCWAHRLLRISPTTMIFACPSFKNHGSAKSGSLQDDDPFQNPIGPLYRWAMSIGIRTRVDINSSINSNCLLNTLKAPNLPSIQGPIFCWGRKGRTPSIPPKHPTHCNTRDPQTDHKWRFQIEGDRSPTTALWSYHGGTHEQEHFLLEQFVWMELVCLDGVRAVISFPPETFETCQFKIYMYIILDILCLIQGDN